MIIGITGPECSGKDTAAAYFAKKGFTSFSLSDEIRKECTARGLATDTPTLARIANELREQHGAEILARRALAHVEPGKNYVINSIRNPAEAEHLKTHGKLALIKLDASPLIRYQRHIAREGRSKYPSYHAFVAAEEAQKSTNPLHQQLQLVFSMADYHIANDSDVLTLTAKLDTLLNTLKTASLFQPHNT